MWAAHNHPFMLAGRTARVSGPAVKQTGSRARASLNPAVVSSGKSAAPALLRAAQPGIERVTQAVAQEVEGEHGDGERQRREDSLVGIAAEAGRASGDHGAPGGCGRVDAQADEGEEGLGGDVTRNG